ncbi:MAG: hypothetical protein CYG60_13530 [Actinobacteria bacterium]|nr:MAG: hypothetical protein CYG60_13530 [Actinomycetota bacterium]
MVEGNEEGGERQQQNRRQGRPGTSEGDPCRDQREHPGVDPDGKSKALRRVGEERFDRRDEAGALTVRSSGDPPGQDARGDPRNRVPHVVEENEDRGGHPAHRRCDAAQPLDEQPHRPAHQREEDKLHRVQDRPEARDGHESARYVVVGRRVEEHQYRE